MPAQLHLLTGPEFGERNDRIDAIQSEMRRTFGEIDTFSFYAADVRISEVVNQLSSESFFSAGTCVVLKNAELIKKKDDIELLGSWAKNCSIPSNALILVSDELSVDSKLDRLVPKENKKVFWEMFENKKEGWIRSFFQTNGYSIESDVPSVILDMVENNTEALRSECGRFFFCFPKTHVITAADVEQMLAHNREESAFTLFDAMAESGVDAAKRFENALLVLQKILLSKNAGGTALLLAGLSSCFRKLSAWHALHAGGAIPGEAELKAGGFAGKTIRAHYAAAAQTWTRGQCAAILALLSQTDMEIRAGGAAFQTTRLFLLVYELVLKKGAECAPYDID